MSYKAFLCAMCGVMIVFFFIGCKPKEQTIVVNVFRDVQSGFVQQHDHKLLQFQARKPRTSSGKLIIVQNILPTHSRFEEMLADGLAMMRPDLVVLDAPDQIRASPVLKHESVNAQNTCGKVADCPTFIPSWVSGEKLEATEQVLRALASDK